MRAPASGTALALHAGVLDGTLKGWRRRWTATGVEMTLGDDPAAGVVRLKPQVWPPRSLRTIVAEALAELAAAGPARVTAASRLITDEQEHAAIVALEGEGDLRWPRRRIGVVLADTAQAVIDCRFDAGHEDRFGPFMDALVKGFPMLSARRLRRFEFQPPAGWAVRSRGLLTHAFAPSFARDGTFLSVPPAERPGIDSLLKKLVYEDLVQGVARVEPLGERALSLPSGLAGRLVAARAIAADRSTVVQAVLLGDARFQYVVRLQSSVEIDPDLVLLPAARSIRPVPAAAGAPAHEVAALSIYRE